MKMTHYFCDMWFTAGFELHLLKTEEFPNPIKKTQAILQRKQSEQLN